MSTGWGRGSGAGGAPEEPPAPGHEEGRCWGDPKGRGGGGGTRTASGRAGGACEHLSIGLGLGPRLAGPTALPALGGADE